MGCRGNHAILNYQMGVSFMEYRVFTLSCLIEPFEFNKQCSQEFNVGLIIPWGSSLCNGFVLIFNVFTDFHEYAN